MMRVCISHLHAQNDNLTHTHTHPISCFIQVLSDIAPGSLKWLIWQGIFGCIAGCKNRGNFCDSYCYFGHWFYYYLTFWVFFVWRLV